MDPVAATEATHIMGSPSAFAAMIAVALGLMKLLEVAIMAIVKKYTGKDGKPVVEVTLDPALIEKISSIADEVSHVHDVIRKTDNDGTPMVYSSRSGIEAVRELTMLLKSVSLTQERLAHVMDRLENKFIDHDRQDALIQNAINSTLERLLKAFDEHDNRVMEAIRLQNEIKHRIEHIDNAQ